MNKILKDKLVVSAAKLLKNDLSHSLDHIQRVMNLAIKIAKVEKADLDVVMPAALFHDIVVYKGTKKQSRETEESAKIANQILRKTEGYPQAKIKKVTYAISVCSFSKNINPKTLEAKILQDADLLEATGAISIMRTFASSTIIGNRALYDSKDPFAEHRKPDDKQYSLDLFFTRLLIAHNRMHTKTAKAMARRRTKFLKSFLTELRSEIKEST